MAEKVNITIGRFQPFTKGHLNMITEGELPCIVYRINSSNRDLSKIKGKKITKSEVEHVIDFIKGEPVKLTEREKELLKRPFSNELIEKELDIVKRNYRKYIKEVIYVKTAFEALEDFQTKVESGEYEPNWLMCGDDRVDSYKDMIGRCPGLKGKIEPNIGSGRSSGVSGSLVRKSILEGNRSDFNRMMPDGTGSMFEEFQNAFTEFLKNLESMVQESRSLSGYLKESLGKLHKFITEGGAAGHMSHPYDYDEMTGKEICNLIGTLFSGQMENVKEKLDGTNIFATMNPDGEVVFIRNKGDLNSPRGGMTIYDMADKWKDKPGVQQTFLTAGRIITEVFQKLGQSYFNPQSDVRKVINCECIIAGQTNVMIYKEDRVAFHGYVLYKKEGDSWIEWKRVEGHVEDIYNAAVEVTGTKPRPDLIIKSMQEADRYKSEFINEVKQLFRPVGLNGTLRDLKLMRFKEICPDWIESEDLEIIYNRWIDSDKSVRLPELKKKYPDRYDELRSDGKEYIKQIMEPIDDLFIRIGNAFISICDGFTNAGYEDSVIDEITQDMQSVVTSLENGDPDMVSRMMSQMERIGSNGINAAEGVVFTWKGKLMKLTGTFGALNQIIGMKYSR